VPFQKGTAWECLFTKGSLKYCLVAWRLGHSGSISMVLEFIILDRLLLAICQVVQLSRDAIGGGR